MLFFKTSIFISQPLLQKFILNNQCYILNFVKHYVEICFLSYYVKSYVILLILYLGPHHLKDLPSGCSQKIFADPSSRVSIKNTNI